jgi:hypothetical protein
MTEYVIPLWFASGFVSCLLVRHWSGGITVADVLASLIGSTLGPLLLLFYLVIDPNDKVKRVMSYKLTKRNG